MDVKTLRLVVALFLSFVGLPDVGGTQELRKWHVLVGLLDSTSNGVTVTADSNGAVLLRAQDEYSEERFAEAAILYTWLAEKSRGLQRAALFARAGESYGKSGLPGLASEHFRLAGESHPWASGWSAILRARFATDSIALGLLGQSPESAASIARRIGAGIQIRRGNWRSAVTAYRGTGALDSAISVSFRNGDTVLSRTLGFEALRSAEVDVRKFGVAFLRESLTFPTEEEIFAFANVTMELGEHSAAISLLQGAVSRGDSTPRIVWTMGRAQERNGNRSVALSLYEKASTGNEAAAASALYSFGRLLLAQRRFSEAMDALTEFTSAHPTHRSVPAALLAVARRFWAVGNEASGDSVSRLLDESWSRTAQASEVRRKIAAREARSGDIEEAVRWYAAEVAAGGTERNFARYMTSQLLRNSGDSVAANAALKRLALVDSLGYYGFLARTEAGLPPPDFSDATDTAASERISAAIAELDFLLAAGFGELARSHVAYWVGRDSLTADEMLALAAGLIERNTVPAAIRLGWRASRTLGLNDIRVVRTVFPWPFRSLIEAEATEWDVDPYLIAGMIRQESAFDPSATSRVGARGLMQLMPPTAQGRARLLGRGWSDEYLVVPDANLHMGVGHFADLARRSDHLVFALAAYNAGGGNLARWLRRDGMDDPRTFVEKIPFPETRGYVKSVLRNRYIYRALYGGT